MIEITGLSGEGTCTSDSDCYMSTYHHCGYDNCYDLAVFDEETVFRNYLSLSATDRCMQSTVNSSMII